MSPPTKICKTWALLHKSGGKDELNIVACGNRNGLGRTGKIGYGHLCLRENTHSFSNDYNI